MTRPTRGPASRAVPPQPPRDDRPWSKPSLALGGGLMLLILVVGIYLLVRDDSPATQPESSAGQVQIAGLQVIPNVGAGDHRSGPIQYAQNPPAGGPHNAVWQNCGVYAAPVPNETAVHSQEHGAVWITYSPQLPQPGIERLQAIARTQPYVLLSPSSGGSPAPIVLSSWGRQLSVDSPSDQRIDLFLRAFLMSPPAPEPGAPCTGGNGEST